MSSMKFVVLLVAVVYMVNALPVTDQSYLAPYLNKEYKLATSDEHFEEVMKALDVSFLKRKLALLAKPVIKLTEQDGKYTLTSESVFKNTRTTFRLGEEFEEETPDDRVVESIITQDKNKLIHTQKGDKVTTITREFSDDQVKVTVQVDDIVSIRTYVPV
uniref:Lipocalin/cytosolic fatty-acid binding domain-containing protein n=1 Tax=Graphocephala atropunctata TaxID=36148 RepID=A0A1B6KTE4_9HEMI